MFMFMSMHSHLMAIPRLARNASRLARNG